MIYMNIDIIHFMKEEDQILYIKVLVVEEEDIDINLFIVNYNIIFYNKQFFALIKKKIRHNADINKVYLL